MGEAMHGRTRHEAVRHGRGLWHVWREGAVVASGFPNGGRAESEARELDRLERLEPLPESVQRLNRTWMHPTQWGDE